MPPDPKWIRARQRVLRQIKDQVQQHLGPESREIQIYSRNFEADLRRRWKMSNKRELLEAIAEARLVYGADFHAFGQAQRTHLKILRSLPFGREIVLALEALPADADRDIARYLSGRLSEARFLQRVGWENDWGFPWENYRPLFEFARDRGCSVIGLRNIGKASENLKKRDRDSAGRLAELYREKPEALIYVLYGDLHLARHHLPTQVRKVLGEKRLPEVTVFLNSEKIYFQLARRGLESFVDVVRFSRQHFCILSSPPWVQWQSYLLFLEKTSDRDLGEDGEEGGFDYTDHVSDFIRLLARDFSLHVKADDLAVYDSSSDRIWTWLQGHLDASERKLAQEFMAMDRSFFLPDGGVCYLAQPTVNHAADLAGQYIHARLCGRTRPVWNLPQDFPALIFTESIGYFFSKLINHKRQSETLADLKAQLTALHPRDRGREALLLALDQSLSEALYLHKGQMRPARYRPRRKSSYLEAGRILGGMMGEKLYHAFRLRRLSMKAVIRWMQQDVTAPSFPTFYREVLLKLGGEMGPVKTRKERL